MQRKKFAISRNLVLWTTVLLVTLGTTLRSTAGNDDVVVVVNQANATAELSRGDLRAIFLTRKTSWPSGSEILALNLPESNNLRRQFDRAVLGLDQDEIAKYWIDRKIRGGTGAPKKVSSSLTVSKVVSDSAAAVGYLRRSEVTHKMRIVAVLQGDSVVGP